MTLHLTRDILVGCYDFLNETPPFNKWNLPDSDDVKFSVIKSSRVAGVYICHRKRGVDKHAIKASCNCIGHTASLLPLMAHEMNHLHQRVNGLETPGVEHNAAFWRDASLICKIHGFDPKAF